MSQSPTILGGPCEYCDKARSIHRDHIVSRADRRRYKIDANDTRFHAAACGDCNWRKLDSRLVPPSKPELVDELNELMAGTRWRIYKGGTVR